MTHDEVYNDATWTALVEALCGELEKNFSSTMEMHKRKTMLIADARKYIQHGCWSNFNPLLRYSELSRNIPK